MNHEDNLELDTTNHSSFLDNDMCLTQVVLPSLMLVKPKQVSLFSANVEQLLLLIFTGAGWHPVQSEDFFDVTSVRDDGSPIQARYC